MVTFVNMLTMVCVQLETGIPNRADFRASVASFPGHAGRRKHMAWERGLARSASWRRLQGNRQ